jgi:hypothetical protein
MQSAGQRPYPPENYSALKNLFLGWGFAYKPAEISTGKGHGKTKSSLPKLDLLAGR